MSTRVTAPEGDGVETLIPGSDRPVRLWRLHADPLTGANVSLVRFPPGWSRPGIGHYSCAEEFVVLEGEISVGRSTFREGDYAYLPPRAARSGSTSEPGCLAIAYFSAAPRWESGPPPDPPDLSARHVPADKAMREDAVDVPGTCVVVPSVPAETVDFGRDLLSLTTGEWVWVAAASVPPPVAGPVLVRTWRDQGTEE